MSNNWQKFQPELAFPHIFHWWRWQCETANCLLISYPAFTPFELPVTALHLEQGQMEFADLSHKRVKLAAPTRALGC